jgi:hypothetical protein
MPRPPKSTSPNRVEAKKILDEVWESVLNDESQTAPQSIHKLVNSDQTAIRFCLPTQLLGKLTDNALDALCLQRGDAPADVSRWDPRGFAAKVVVPWNRSNQNVLGPSGDPYVGNPLRRPRLDSGLDQMADRDEWERLCEVLREVEKTSDKEHTRGVFSQVLTAIRDRLRDLEFVYVVPNRVSLRQAETLVDGFLREKSGGDRGLAVAAALFETVRERLQVYKEVRRSVINAADAATRSVGDLECIGSDGAIVLAVEVKERRIGDDDVHIAIAKTREFAVRELIFCCDGITTADQAAVEKTFANAWASGTNLYQVTIKDLMRGLLPLLGEDGIKTFVTHVGLQLDKFSTQPKHRKAWKLLLDGL